ncbi:MAG: chemotaxis response regulator protein-glutamate methylesterase [candidate division Zixibacteria bacterium]|nr:chemotaxis response regulator protein-glutamate methylesterase [candidate division Zixibacteria bacterium]
MPVSDNKEIRILVVDDSAFMRKAITIMLESDPQIKVIGTARDGAEGLEKVQLLKPDLVTMDIEMPRMDGLTALREIMQKHPVPVMMVSSITTEGARATLDALELGAVDFIPKQMSYVSLDIVKIKDELLNKIKDIVRRKHLLMSRFRQRQFDSLKTGPVSTKEKPAESPPVEISSLPVVKKRQHIVNIIAIGSSTGGPPALQSIIPKLPRNLPVGIVIAQHMPPMFTKSLADRLDSLSEVTVREAENGQVLEPGLVLIAPGGKHLLVKRRGTRPQVVVTTYPEDTLYHPCVDVMMNSVADAYGRSTMGVILTGMGSNGLEGLALLKKRGGVIIAQNEATCVVYGMPRAIIEAKLADHIAPIDRIAHEIISYF